MKRCRKTFDQCIADTPHVLEALAEEAEAWYARELALSHADAYVKSRPIALKVKK